MKLFKNKLVINYEKIFITGGTGTVGKFLFLSIMRNIILYLIRNEKEQVSLKRLFQILK